MKLFAFVRGLKRQHASRAAGFVAVTIGTAALVGWWTGLSTLSSWGSGLATMKPTTALCVAALGFALVRPGEDSRVAFAVGLAVAFIAALNLGQDLFGVDFGINRSLESQGAVPGPDASSFRTINGTAFAIALAGSSVALSRFEGRPFAAIVLGSVAGSIAMFALLGYIAGTDTLYGSPSVSSPALPASVGLLFVASGVVLRIGTIAATRQVAEDLLRDSERQLRVVADNAPVGIVQWDRKLRYKFVNKFHAERLAEWLGLTLEHVIGKSLPEVIGGELFAIVEPYVSECLAGKPVEFEVEVPSRSGEPQFLHCRFAPEWRDGKVVGLVSAGTNITDLKRAEQRLRASEIAFRQFVENSPFGIFTVDADFHFAQMSVGAQKTFEKVRPLIGRDLAEVFRCVLPEPFASDAIGRFRHTLDSGEPYHARGSGERRRDTDAVESYDWKIERAIMPDGRFGVVCHFYDLSERHQYESALRESEATFRAMFDASSVGKIEIDPHTGRFLRVNAAMCKFVGYSEAELLGRTVFDITHSDERDRDREALRRERERDYGPDAEQISVFDREKRYIRKDGKAVWARVTANTIRDASGRPLRNTAVVLDITPRKQAEQDLQASKDRLQLAFDATRLGWWQYDLLRHIGSGDSRFKEIFDLTADEISIEDLMERVHPDDAERVWADRQAALDPANPKRSASEFRIRRRNGQICWVEAHRLAYFEGAGPERRAVSFGGTVQDITERKEREEKEHLLMREINHRAKNMLSVVDAIAHQTASRNPEDFIERFSERIQALSANQDLLVRNEWNGVEIADLVRAQLAPFADLIGSRIAVLGLKLRLNAASAQAIGLALHELSTNAGKYGALSTDKGCVDICWATDGDTFTMSWTERNGPPVSAPKRRGFGTIVMEAMAERSVGGKVDLDYAPSGVTWRLTCPAGSAVESGWGS
jgi:PAS domain S-box-containing protein